MNLHHYCFSTVLRIPHRAHYSTQPLSTLRFLSGKTAIVTGSTSGIGLGIATALAARGANIILNGFGNTDEIKQTQQKIEMDNHVKVHYHPADMTKSDHIRSMVKETTDLFGSVDILVNNAGIQYVSPVEEFPDEKWDSIISINLSSAFHAIKAVLPKMKQNQWGRIINTASVHGLVASKNKSAYVAAKHGIVGLTKAVALETAGSGITANCVNPGWVLTPLVELQISVKAKKEGITIDEASKQLLEEKQPSKQFATVQQIGGVVVFLCSGAADQLTGVSIPVDGGWTAQ